jgi:hypothetical protein
METALAKLVEKFPPPTRTTAVQWDKIESELGFSYPQSHKDFVNTYGASVWFDDLFPIICYGKTKADIRKYKTRCSKLMLYLKGNTYDDEYNNIEPLLYPTRGGLFPFMMDTQSQIYTWDTSKSDPDVWPVVCWMTGTILKLKNISIAKMIIDWIERKKSMRDVWADVNDFDPARLCITEFK